MYLTRAILVLFVVTLAEGQTDRSMPNLQAGRKIFESQCALCHGANGGGGRGPSLHRPKLERAPDDAALRKLIAEGIPPEMPEAWQLSPPDIANLAAFVRSLGAVPPEAVPGDPAKGVIVYREKNCASCHIVNGVGTGFGPELSTIGAHRNATHLREALIKPAAFVPDDFVLAEVVTASGEPIRGIRANEDSFTIQIKDAAGRFYSFRKDEVRSWRLLRDQSAMPAFDQSLSPGELMDLVAYLASLRGSQ
jgi:putative heme-binding domain-containing protein